MPSGYKLLCNKVCTERPGYIHSKKVLLVRGYIGIVESNMESTIVYWGSMAMMEMKWKLL